MSRQSLRIVWCTLLDYTFRNIHKSSDQSPESCVRPVEEAPHPVLVKPKALTCRWHRLRTWSGEMRLKVPSANALPLQWLPTRRSALTLRQKATALAIQLCLTVPTC
jgi:hypothetical protein